MEDERKNYIKRRGIEFLLVIPLSCSISVVTTSFHFRVYTTLLSVV